MVYGALVVTPMHDVLIGVALLFFVTAFVPIVQKVAALSWVAWLFLLYFTKPQQQGYARRV